MKPSTNTILIIFGILFLGVMAMFPITIVAAQFLGSQSDGDSQTVEIAVTQTVLAMTLNAPTQTPLPLTPTTAPATYTATPTSTGVPSTTYCDWVAFVKDVTIQDGAILAPGETFTKTWRLKNIGTCTWTPDYQVSFHSGTQMSGTSMQVPGYIAPGQTVDVAVTFTAPTAAGHYIGYWTLKNKSGALFGTGNRADEPFYVDIEVKDLTYGTVTGSLCYPSEFNPPMTLYFEKVGNGENIQFAIVEAQNIYEVLLPIGTYYVHAWAPNYNLEGAYADPNTNLMIPVQVYSGKTTNMINLCNWSPYPHGRIE